jgi:hypothetical protein
LPSAVADTHDEPVTSTQVRAAALNNVAWCDLVCQSHEVRTITSKQFWVALQRTPPQYPDAVSLTENLNPAGLLRMIQNSSGASVKDSFADLDLAGSGYEVLFTADWIFREAAEPTELPVGWSVVGTPEELATWAAAGGLSHLIRADLLENPDVRIIGRGDEAGAVLNRSDSVVGVSNLFTTVAGNGIDRTGVWTDVINSAASLFPGLALCGYEHGDDLDGARKAGFAAVGPLRIWVKP